MRRVGGGFRTIGLLVLSHAALVTGLAAQESAIEVEEAPTLVVPQAASSTEGWLRVRNTGADVIRLELTAGAPSHATHGVSPKARVRFAPRIGVAPSISYEATVAADQVLALRVVVEGLEQPGDWTFDLYDQGVQIGTVTATKGDLPFELAVSPPEDGLVLGPGFNVLVLENKSPVHHTVDWTLALTDSPGRVMGKATLFPAESVKTIELRAPNDWLPRTAEGLLKVRESEALLTLISRPLGGDVLFQTTRIPVSLRGFSESQMLWWGNGLLFAVLLAGGAASLFLNHYVPNKRRQLRLRSLIGELLELSLEPTSRVDSTVRVAAAVQRNRLLRRLNQGWVIWPHRVTSFDRIEEQHGRLRERVTLLQEMDQVYRRVEARYRSRTPPSLLYGAESSLSEACDLLQGIEPGAENLQKAKTLVQEARSKVARGAAREQHLAASLLERRKILKKDFADIEHRKDKPTRKLGRKLRRRLKGVSDVLDVAWTDPEDVPVDALYWADSSIEKLSLIRDYLFLQRDNPCARRYESELVRLLALRSLRSLKRARFLLDQMREGVYIADVEKALTSDGTREEAGSGNLVLELPPRARAFRLLTLKASLGRRLDESSARGDFVCRWDFDHEGLHETGWEVSHYFPPDEKRLGPRVGWSPPFPGLRRRLGVFMPKEEFDFEVKVTIERDETRAAEHGAAESNCEAETGADGSSESVATSPAKRGTADLRGRCKTLTVTSEAKRRRDRTWLELAQLSVALLVAFAGLLSGAREQILKLDFFAGTIAVFLIGVAADQVKNVFARKSN